MQWLIANMWMVLAFAAALGLFFGFSVRGILTGSRVRKATVERDVALTELDQTRAEVDALYAAQRKHKEDGSQPGASSDGADAALRADLAERDTRLTALGDELSAARAEIETLKSTQDEGANGLQTAGAALAGAVGGAVLSGADEKELTELKERNTWLEERVSALETDLSAAQVVAEPVAVVADSDEAGSAVAEKMQWQNGYLRQRVEALETKVVEASAVALPAIADPALDVEEPANEAEPSEHDEELARLRWRNRYLEGRLAYHEERADAEDAAASEAPAETKAPSLSEVAAVGLGIAAATKAVADDETETEPEEETQPDPEPEAKPEPEPEPEAEPKAEPEPEAIVPVVEEDKPHPSEAMLAELEQKDAEGKTKPTQLEKPEAGGDDLTAIVGIGPRISEVLNELGIWTYGQIADWDAENEAWIEDHLSFQGRVTREKWVEQANALAS